MKKSISYARLVLIAGAVFSLPVAAVMADETNASVAQTNQLPAVTKTAQAIAPTTTTKLPYGVEDVLKLSRANVSEDIILNYIQNSGTIYNLGPQDLVYLRDQGVSDHVLNAMLNQRKVVEAAAQTAQSTVAPGVPDASMVPIAPTYTDSAPAPMETQAAPAAASSVYVIPYPQAAAAYYGYASYYPYYGYRYCSPSVVVGVGYGGYCYRGHNYYGHAYHGHGYGHGHGWHH